MLIAGIIALAAIVLALGALGFAAMAKPAAANEESFGDRLGVAIFDMANSLFISRLGALAARFLVAKPKRST
ncbi:MAG: hypothetical protein WDN06_02815 [Asticcacaulis sp.]